MKQPVTYLFVPGNRAERFDKALASGADAVILDLEDAVTASDKDAARDSVASWTKAHSNALAQVLVRINDCTSPWFEADLALLRTSPLQFAMLPKTESDEQVNTVCGALRAGGKVLPLIETARGVANVSTIAAAAGVQRLVFGTLDYGVDLDLSGDERGLIYPAAQIAIASRCAGIGTPVAGVTTATGDDERLRSDLAFDRAFGYGAKLCIHPRQVPIVREAFLPSPAEVEWATRVVAVVERSPGAVQVDGRMVDRPVLLRARAILDRATH